MSFKFCILTISFSIYLFPQQTHGASAVAANKASGAYGYAYGQKTEDEAKKLAIKNCPGGGDIIASTSKDGYGAVLRTVNNWKKEGEVITVKGIMAQADPVGVRKPGTGECPTCQIIDIWYDNASSTDKEKFEGSGSKRAPEVLVVEATNRRDGEFRDLKVIDGREFRHGFGISYTNPETKTIMKEKKEYYMGLWDGMDINYKYLEGQEPIIDYEVGYKDGWRHGFTRSFGVTGAVKDYTEYAKGKQDGAFYAYDFKGILNKKGRYKNGVKHGLFCDYSNGIITETGYYEYNEREGEWLTYDKDGITVVRTRTYAKGMVISETKTPKKNDKPKPAKKK
jgi:hypothetical protein